MLMILLKFGDPSIRAWKVWFYGRTFRGDLYLCAIGGEVRRYGLFLDIYLYFCEAVTTLSLLFSSRFCLFIISYFSAWTLLSFLMTVLLPTEVYFMSLAWSRDLSCLFYSFNYFNSRWLLRYFCSFYSNKSLHFEATA